MTVRDLIQELLVKTNLDNEIRVRDYNGNCGWPAPIIIINATDGEKEIVLLDAPIHQFEKIKK